MVVVTGGIAMEPIPSAEQDRTLLGDRQLFEIAALTKRIEQLFQHPVDVEWAIDREGLWALQARPVTAVQASSDPTNEES